MFVPLEMYSNRGFIEDSTLSVEEYINSSKIPYLGITDLVASYSFFVKCKEKNIKPIIGYNLHGIYYFAIDDIGLEELFYLYNIGNFSEEENKKHLIAATTFFNSSSGEIESTIQEYKLKYHEIYFAVSPLYSIEYNKMILDLSKEYIIPTVYLSNIRASKKEDVYHLLINSKNFKDNMPGYIDHNPQKKYLMLDFTEAIENTQKIAEQCNITFQSSVDKNIKNSNIEFRLYWQCIKELIHLKNIDLKEYLSRLEYEFEVLKKKQYLSYIAIVKDYVDYMDEKNIIRGFGRGSSCSSLICFLLKITHVDPIRYGLLFKRFIDENRDELPDIDIDVQSSKKEEVREYLVEKYDENNILNISILLKDKDGNPKRYMKHPSGIIISKENLIKKMPISGGKTLFFSSELSNLQYVKYDILSSNYLNLWKDLESNENYNINTRSMALSDFNDKNVWKIIQEDREGLFQISGKLYDILKDIKPISIPELADCLALLRPSCLKTKSHLLYLKYKNNNIHIKVDPVYDYITKDTYGLLLYQEQIMQLCIQLGLESNLAYELMKKGINHELENVKKIFNMVSLEENRKNTLLKKIINFCQYSFNKSHAVAYAMMIYKFAYLKYRDRKKYLSLIKEKRRS